MPAPRHVARRFGIAYFAAGVAGVAAAVIAESAHAALGFSSGLWLQVAVLMLLSAFVLEPRFTSSATAVTNALAVILLGLGADSDELDSWWWLLIVAAALSLVLNLAGYGSQPSDDLAHRRRRVVVRLGVQTGSWKALLLPGLFLSLASFNEPLGDEWRIGAGVAVYSIALASVRPHDLLWDTRRDNSRSETAPVVGLYPPTGILLAARDLEAGGPGRVVTLTSDWGQAEALVLGPSLAGGGAGWWLFAPELRSVVPDGRDGAELAEVVVAAADGARADLALPAEELATAGTTCAGVLGEGSSVREVVFDALSGVPLTVGEVLWTRSTRGRCYWQVTDASVQRVSWAGDARRSVRATATQIGAWSAERLGFEVDVHAPQPDDLVFRSAQGRLAVDVGPIVGHRIGYLVGSDFPVVLDLGRLGRQHAAILGTTGTGKTHLAFDLISGLAEAGSKVVCVDITGQYASRFPEAAVLHSSADVVAFFNDGDGQVAVLTPEGTNPVLVLNAVARALLGACRDAGALAPNDGARCVVVVDEAHNFIPEAFVVNDWDLKAKAQDTSMVLMESRKFGLGFVLVSQRTAMVTKSALSQCNTVFAFQAVDQTGLDYIEGLCGRALARSLPTLPHRTAVVMGQALTSNAPVVVFTDDAVVAVP